MLKYLMLLAIISNAEQLTVVQQFQQLTRQLPFLGSTNFRSGSKRLGRLFDRATLVVVISLNGNINDI